MGQKVQNKEIQLTETDQEASNLKENKIEVSQPNEENKQLEQQESQDIETQITDKVVSCPRCLHKNQFNEDHVQCKCKLDFCVHCKYDIMQILVICFALWKLSFSSKQVTINIDYFTKLPKNQDKLHEFV